MTSLQISTANRRYGVYRDNPNSPAKFLLRAPQPTVEIPRSFSLTESMGYIRDQGNEGSCTGQMGAEIRDFLYRKYFNYEKTRGINPKDFRSSASFIYKNNLIADGVLGHDLGSTIHQTFITLNQKGTCPEEYEPYSDTDFSTVPTEKQYQTALVYKGGAYHSLWSLQEIKNCIASGYSCGFGIDVYSSFESYEFSQSGLMPLPTGRESLLGGHAQHALAYDDDFQFPNGLKGSLFIQNSWGTEWGISAPGRSDRGCYRMPYQYYLDGHVHDAWMMHLGPAWK